jgi:hypothetical protein
MQFLLLIYGQEQRYATFSEADHAAEHQAYMGFGQQFRSAIQGGNALQATSTAKTVRVRGGKELVTDGPFAETKEQLGGYYLVEAPDEAAAIAIAAKIPAALHGSVEVRPIMHVN